MTKYQESADEVLIRMTDYDDIDDLIELSNLGYSNPELAGSREQYESRIKRFPTGQLCAEYQNKIIGTCSSLIVNFEEYGYRHDYNAISGEGYITNHIPDGLNLYGINVVVHPEYRQLQIGKRLYEGRKRLCKELNLKSIIIGGRMPDYYKYSDEFEPLQYVNEVKKGNIYDSVLSFQLKNGFIFKDVIPNYLPGDSKSQEFGALMEWSNPYFVPEY